MTKSRRKALKSITQEKVVNIGDYRHLKSGRTVRKVAVLSTNQAMIEGLTKQLEKEAELDVFDTQVALENGIKKGEWDGIVLDHRDLKDDTISLCEKLKKTGKLEEVFVVILSDDDSKDTVRVGYEKGVDEWITRLDDLDHLAKLIAHHLSS